MRTQFVQFVNRTGMEFAVQNTCWESLHSALLEYPNFMGHCLKSESRPPSLLCNSFYFGLSSLKENPRFDTHSPKTLRCTKSVLFLSIVEVKDP